MRAATPEGMNAGCGGPWFIATETFDGSCGHNWKKYVAWSGLKQLDEVVTLDQNLCPPVLTTVKDEYWPYIVNEDFMTNFFLDLQFLLQEISSIRQRNLLCVYRNPPGPPPPYQGPVSFGLLGYDLVDVHGNISALVNCHGFPDVFANGELSSKGLLTSHERALQVQSELQSRHPGESHANCHVWAISRALIVDFHHYCPVEVRTT